MIKQGLLSCLIVTSRDFSIGSMIKPGLLNKRIVRKFNGGNLRDYNRLAVYVWGKLDLCVGLGSIICLLDGEIRSFINGVLILRDVNLITIMWSINFF
jgi:hypothetical protein